MESVEPRLITLLEEYEIIHLIENFIDGDVLSCSLVTLLEDESDLKALAPKVGERLKLKSLIKKLKAGSLQNQILPPLDRTVSTADTVILDEDEILSPVSPENVLPHVVLSGALQENQLGGTVSSCPKYPSETDANTSSSSEQQIEWSKLTRKKILENLTTEKVKGILTSSNLGSAVLKHYAEHRELLPSHQDIVVRAIMESLVEDERSSLSSTVMMDVANAVVELFPSENRDTYYFISHDGKRKRYAGKVFNRYKNHKLILSKWLKSSSGRSHDVNEPVNCGPTDEEVKKTIWLKHHISPWNQVTQYWTETTNVRVSKNRKEGSLDSIVANYPALKTDLGYQLVRILKTN